MLLDIVESLPPRPQTQGTFPPTENTQPVTSVFLPPSSTSYPTDESDGTSTAGFSTTPFGSSSSYPLDSSSSSGSRPSPTPEDLYTINQNNFPATLPSANNNPDRNNPDLNSPPYNNQHQNNNNDNNEHTDNRNQFNNENNNPPANVPSNGQQPLRPQLPPDHPCSFCSQSHKKPVRPERPSDHPYDGHNMPGPYNPDRNFDRDRYPYPPQGPDPFPGYRPDINSILYYPGYGPAYPMEREYDMYAHNAQPYPIPAPPMPIPDAGYGPSMSFAGNYPDSDMNAIHHSGGSYGGQNSFPGGHNYPSSNQGPATYPAGYPSNQGQHGYPSSHNNQGQGAYGGNSQPSIGNRFPDYNNQGNQPSGNRQPSGNANGTSGYNVVEQTPDTPMKKSE